MNRPSRTTYALFVLFAINTMNFYDRLIPGAVGELIKHEWSLSDTALGFLGTAFILLYAVVGVPLGRFADRHNRSRILAIGVFAWSLLTAASGLARNFWQMVGLRLAVGVGEATCAPASSSLIGDLFPATARARAMAVFMMGLPVGNALSYAISGRVAHQFGWQSAFYIALLPGVACAVGAFFIVEPRRGGTELHQVGAQRRHGSPYFLVLSIPTMWWIILSGALHNFNMYALGSFLVPFLMRYHGAELQHATDLAAAMYGLAGIPGLLVGGFLGDRIIRVRRNGRMLVATVAIVLSVPLMILALGRPPRDLIGFSLLLGLGCLTMYTYYSTVYSTIQDVIEPSLRGTAMALYFMAMYLLGAVLGPLGLGVISDFFTRRAAIAGGVDLTGLQGAELVRALIPFSPQGTHTAMYVVPLVGAALAAVLFAGSRTVTGDAERLERWMRDSASASHEHAVATNR